MGDGAEVRRNLLAAIDRHAHEDESPQEEASSRAWRDRVIAASDHDLWSEYASTHTSYGG